MSPSLSDIQQTQKKKPSIIVDFIYFLFSPSLSSCVLFFSPRLRALLHPNNSFFHLRVWFSVTAGKFQIDLDMGLVLFLLALFEMFVAKMEKEFSCVCV